MFVLWRRRLELGGGKQPIIAGDTPNSGTSIWPGAANGANGPTIILVQANGIEGKASCEDTVWIESVLELFSRWMGVLYV